MAYIYPAPGVSGAEVTLSLTAVDTATYGNVALDVPGLQNITVNNANDVYTWTQLDAAGKKQIATTSTNSLEMNLVLDQTKYFGTGTGTLAAEGIFGISKKKIKVSFSLYMGDTDSGGTGKTLTGQGYITGLAPTVSADQPVWVSPITLTVDGDFTVA